ncbi:MAG: HU-CCDC81 and SPOR domain-containing protein [Bacteroidia bacterium]|nr:HU-CCDC81 and SPOR domain-containing protein [Bacteroidia bacterium]
MEKQIPVLVAEMLYHHDCVIIPGFGGFVARHVPSFMHPGLHTVHPPSKSVLFNKNLVNNDGLLANGLIEKFNFSYPKAVAFITQFAEDCHRQLHQNLRLEMENIGVLYLDAEKNIQFEPRADLNYLLQSFGLSEVYAHPVLQVEIKPKEKEEVFKDRKADFDRAQSDKTEKSVVARRTRMRKLVAVAVAAPFVLGLAFLLSTGVAPKNSALADMNPFRTKEKPHYTQGRYTPKKIKEKENPAFNQIELSSDGTAKIVISEDPRNIVFVFVKDIDPAKDKTNVKNKIKNLPYSKKHVSGNFQVILGCFGVKDNADRLVQNLNSRNINAGISGVNNNGLYVVSAGGFDTKDSANVLLNSIRQSYPSAWIMAK